MMREKPMAEDKKSDEKSVPPEPAPSRERKDITERYQQEIERKRGDIEVSDTLKPPAEKPGQGNGGDEKKSD